MPNLDQMAAIWHNTPLEHRNQLELSQPLQRQIPPPPAMGGPPRPMMAPPPPPRPFSAPFGGVGFQLPPLSQMPPPRGCYPPSGMVQPPGQMMPPPPPPMPPPLSMLTPPVAMEAESTVQHVTPPPCQFSAQAATATELAVKPINERSKMLVPDLSEEIDVGGFFKARKGEAVMIQLTCKGNEISFDLDEVAKSIRVTATRKGFDSPAHCASTPAGFHLGPWDMVISAELADELLEDGDVTIFKQTEEDEREITALIKLYSASGSICVEGKEARIPRGFVDREEKKQRTMRFYLILPSSLAMRPDETVTLAVEKARKIVTDHFAQNGAIVHVVFLTTDHGMQEAKACVYIEVPKGQTIVDYMTALEQKKRLTAIKYFDLGESQPARLNAATDTLQLLGIKQCCLTSKECTGIKDCSRRDSFFSDRRAANFRAQPSKKVEKRQREDELSMVAKSAIEMKASRQVCRAFLKGRCAKGEGCFENHFPKGGSAADEKTFAKTIKCCSQRQPTDEGYSTKHDVCKFSAQECPYDGHVGA
jgi:hypothetical protein